MQALEYRGINAASNLDLSRYASTRSNLLSL
jgi:hypothetical protein